MDSLVTRIPFDPRRASDGKPIGHWPLQSDTGRPGAEDDELTLLADSVRRFEASTHIPRGLSENFIQEAVRGGGVASPGMCNSPTGQSWGEAEGLDADGMLFCDGVADWWPEVSRTMFLHAV